MTGESDQADDTAEPQEKKLTSVDTSDSEEPVQESETDDTPADEEA